MVALLRKTKRGRKGFTLTELIVVIAILGILATVATPMVMDYVTDAKKNTDASNAQVIEDIIKRSMVKAVLPRPLTSATDVTNEVLKELNPIPSVKQYTNSDGSSNGFFQVKTDGTEVTIKEGNPASGTADTGYLKVGP